MKQLPIILLVLLLHIPAAADTITIVADGWCPFNCQPGSEKPGYMIEIAQTVFSKAGHEIKYSNLQWDEALMETRQGTYTAVVGASKDDAPDFVFPEVSLGTAGSVFFVKEESSWHYAGLDSLKTVKIGIIKSYSYGDTLDSFFEQKEKTGEVLVSSGDQPLDVLIDQLMSGKIDALIEDPAVLTDYLVDNGMLDILSKLKEAGQEGVAQPIFIAFSPVNPKSKEYADILAKGLTELRKSGGLSQILKKYEIKDWQKPN